GRSVLPGDVGHPDPGQETLRSDPRPLRRRPRAPSAPALDHLDPRDAAQRDAQLAVHLLSTPTPPITGRRHRLASSRQPREEGIGFALTLCLMGQTNFLTAPSP